MEDVLRKLTEIGNEIAEIKKGVHGGNHELELVKKQQLLILKGTHAQEEKINSIVAKVDELSRNNEVKEQIGELKDTVDTVRGYMDHLAGEVGTLQIAIDKLQGNGDSYKNLMENFTKTEERVLQISQTVEEQGEIISCLGEELQDVVSRKKEKEEEPKPSTLTFRCRKCRSELPEDIRIDHVSIICINPDCKRYNIVGDLRPEHRWVKNEGCVESHYTQIPTAIKKGTVQMCTICGAEGKVSDRNNFKAILA